MIELQRPTLRPANPRFSTGPCSKPPGWKPENLPISALGRGHRSTLGRSRLRQVITKTRELLRIPKDYRVGIVPGSDTGAVEMALWSLLGPRSVDMLVWESFGKDWAVDATEQLTDLDVRIHDAEYGHLPDLTSVDFNADVVFAWNGTTSGVCVPNGDFIADDRAGLTICDATSAAFAVDLPWEKLDATTFSWQKVLGGEAAHGMLVLSPRAVDRLENHVPRWPVPKLFRLTAKGRLNEGIFDGATINTPSLLCVEDCIWVLNWAEQLGGLDAMIARANANAAALNAFVARVDWLRHLAQSAETRSNTSVCLTFHDPGIPADEIKGFASGVAARLEYEHVAFDIGSYRAAPPGLRIWCGATVETSDLELLFPWIEWAYKTERAAHIGTSAE